MKFVLYGTLVFFACSLSGCSLLRELAERFEEPSVTEVGEEDTCVGENCDARAPASYRPPMGSHESTGFDVNRGSSAVLPEEYYKE
ncbi:MAG: hypothetical protein AB7F59_01970 [Bdellovibrionales bacterium]